MSFLTDRSLRPRSSKAATGGCMAQRVREDHTCAVRFSGLIRINKDGSSFLVLRHFTTAAGEPYNVFSSLFEASDGVLYGTSFSGGNYEGGTVFKINKDGRGYAVVHHFTMTGNARQPSAALVEGRDGALYGTTEINGTNYTGAIFKIQKDGSGFSVLREFAPKDGTQSEAELLLASDGAFYGTAPYGGDLNVGTVFRLGHALGLQKELDVAYLQLTGVPGCTYDLQRSTDLQTWSVLYTATMPESARLELTDPAPPASAAFYRTVAR